MMRIQSLALVVCVTGAVWATGDAWAQQTDGAWIVEGRLRYEGVSQDGLEDADALTLRARLGYETGAFYGLKGLVEAEGVAHLNEDFNDTVNGNTAFALVPDPEAIEINRLQLAWSGQTGSQAVLGRQRIVLGDGRFIGNSGFRQNEQTFDALRLDWRPSQRLALTYVYFDNIRRVFGDDSPQGLWRSDSHALQGDVNLPIGKVSAYALLLDFQNAPAQSSQTFGARWSQAWDVGDVNARVLIEAAKQQDYRGNTAAFDVGYQRMELALRRDRWTATVGGEQLGGDGVRGFSTPLASLHPYQGWADVFLTTPADGVRDLYAGLSYSTPASSGQPVVFTLAAHEFSDDGGGQNFGSEVDASVRWPLNDRVALEAAGAAFEGDDPRFQDRTKVWLSLEFRL